MTDAHQLVDGKLLLEVLVVLQQQLLVDVAAEATVQVQEQVVAAQLLGQSLEIARVVSKTDGVLVEEVQR